MWIIVELSGVARVVGSLFWQRPTLAAPAVRPAPALTSPSSSSSSSSSRPSHCEHCRDRGEEQVQSAQTVGVSPVSIHSCLYVSVTMTETNPDPFTAVRTFEITFGCPLVEGTDTWVAMSVYEAGDVQPSVGLTQAWQ